jgi:hypothetical protein
MQEFCIRGRILTATAIPKLDANNNPVKDENGKTIMVCPTERPRPGQGPKPAYQSPGERLRIEVWDKDVRFNDRLASGTSDSRGFFEIRFTDEDLRQEFGESEIDPDVFFQVFRQRQFVFTTEGDSRQIIEFPDKPDTPLSEVDSSPQLTFPLKKNQNGEIEPINPNNPDLDPDKQAYLVKEDATCYRLELIEAFDRTIPSEAETPPVIVLPPSEDRVVDVLPTSDQVFGLGRQTSVGVTDNGGGSLQQVVDNALNRVLGQTFRTTQTSNFKDSLNQAFTLQETNGSKTFVWNPRSYSTTQMQLGGEITGAQASLYHRAKAALKEILPLLDGLYALDPSADDQNREAVRSIVRTEIIELVNEFGVPQGPRVQRVDSLFRLLIGSEDTVNLPEQIGGQLKDLTDTFGLSRSRINTVDEERNFGNFLTIKDYMVSLRQSWNDFISIQLGGGGAFVGTQLVLLSQALSVMAESVRETYRIMDLVFLGPEERQSVFIDFTKARSKDIPADKASEIAFPLPDGNTGFSIQDTLRLVPAMDLERLLSWAMRFATEEGPTLARSGGKLGIAKAIAETARDLMILLQAASFVPIQNTAFKRAGVVRALRDLAFQTYQVQRLAKELIPPSLSGQRDDIKVSPSLLPNNNSGGRVN